MPYVRLITKELLPKCRSQNMDDSPIGICGLPAEVFVTRRIPGTPVPYGEIYRIASKPQLVFPL
jgi:hypothetical protein